jgi:hypothetical protein
MLTKKKAVTSEQTSDGQMNTSPELITDSVNTPKKLDQQS